jgi:hypothetical protein
LNLIADFAHKTKDAVALTASKKPKDGNWHRPEAVFC